MFWLRACFENDFNVNYKRTRLGIKLLLIGSTFCGLIPNATKDSLAYNKWLKGSVSIGHTNPLNELEMLLHFPQTSNEIHMSFILPALECDRVGSGAEI